MKRSRSAPSLTRTGPKGALLRVARSISIRGGHENPTGQKLCPVFVKRDTLFGGADSVFCCPRNQQKRKLSAAAVQTETNVNKHVHYEFMCVDDTSAVYLCDPKDGSIVNFYGDKRVSPKKSPLEQTGFRRKPSLTASS